LLADLILLRGSHQQLVWKWHYDLQGLLLNRSWIYHRCWHNISYRIDWILDFLAFCNRLWRLISDIVVVVGWMGTRIIVAVSFWWLDMNYWGTSWQRLQCTLIQKWFVCSNGNGNTLDFIHSLALETNVHGLPLSVRNVERTSSKTGWLSVNNTGISRFWMKIPLPLWDFVPLFPSDAVRSWWALERWFIWWGSNKCTVKKSFAWFSCLQRRLGVLEN